jgi:hypothetical protein
MLASEQITSAEKVIIGLGKGGKQRAVTVSVWNDTVANLTRKALGSSASEVRVGNAGHNPDSVLGARGAGPVHQCRCLYADIARLLRDASTCP